MDLNHIIHSRPINRWTFRAVCSLVPYKTQYRWIFTRISQYDIHSAQFLSFGPTGKSASRYEPTNFFEREFFLTSFRDPRPDSKSLTSNQCVHENPCLYLAPDKYNRRSPLLFSLRSTLTLSPHLIPGHPSGLFPSDFPITILYTYSFSTLLATCLASLVLL